MSEYRVLGYWDRSDCVECRYTSLTGQRAYPNPKGRGEICEMCATGFQHALIGGIYTNDENGQRVWLTPAGSPKETL